MRIAYIEDEKAQAVLVREMIKNGQMQKIRSQKSCFMKARRNFCLKTKRFPLTPFFWTLA